MTATPAPIETSFRRSLPFRMIDILVLKEFVRAFIFIFFLFMAIAFVLVLFDELDVMMRNAAPFGISLVYVLLRIPHEIMKAAPMMVVISVVLSIGSMLKNNEILMLFIAGYSPLRIGAPLAVSLAILIVILFWINENISGPASTRAHELMETRIKGNVDGIGSGEGIWLHGQEDRVYHAQYYMPYSQTVEGLNIFEFRGPNKIISRRLHAKTGQWVNRDWVLYDVVDHRIEHDGSIKREFHDSMTYAFERTPQDFGSVTQNPEYMSHRDLRRIIKAIQRAGENPILYLPDLRIKEAFPFAVFFLGILTFGMILRYGMTASASGIGLGLLAAIGYILLLSLGKSFAKAGFIPPWFGAWLPNMICFLLSIYLFNQLRREV